MKIREPGARHLRWETRHSEVGDGLPVDDAQIPEALRSDDWCRAFTVAAQKGPGITRADVIEVIAKADGERDEEDWVGVFRLRDGRLLYLSAGCDYTGWDCQSKGECDWRGSMDEVVRELCTEDDRKRLGLQLPETSVEVPT